MKARSLWIFGVAGAVGVALLAWEQLQHTRVVRSVFLGRCEQQNSLSIKSGQVLSLDILLASKSGGLALLRQTTGSIVVSSNGVVILSKAFDGREARVANWLDSDDLVAVILSWPEGNDSWHLESALEPGGIYQFKLDFFDPPPAGTSWWLGYAAHVRNLGNPPEVK